MIPWWLRLLAIPVLLVGFQLRRRRPWIGAAWTCLALGVVLAFGVLAARTVWRGSQVPPEWDFQAFWLFGRVASERVDFYDPSEMQRASAGMDLSRGFKREIVDVGAWYPPPSMLLFLPLGWSELQVAYRAWMLVNGALLLIDLWLIWLTFFRSEGWAGFLLGTAMLAVWRPTMDTIYFAQTNFLLLLLLIAGWHRASSARSGALIGMACLVKPVAAALLLVPVVRAQARTLIAAACTITMGLVLSIGVFGLPVHRTYWFSPPTDRMPASAYTASERQSLLATILRATQAPVPDKPIRHPGFLAMALLLAAVTAFIVRRLSAADLPIAWGLALTLGLILYPASLTHYGLLLIVPVSWLWSVRDAIPDGAVWSLALASLVGGLLSRNETTFFAFALTWVAFVGLGVFRILADRSEGQTT